jgi:hypothetical protein
MNPIPNSVFLYPAHRSLIVSQAIVRPASVPHPSLWRALDFQPTSTFFSPLRLFRVAQARNLSIRETPQPRFISL